MFKHCAAAGCTNGRKRFPKPLVRNDMIYTKHPQKKCCARMFLSPTRAWQRFVCLRILKPVKDGVVVEDISI